MRVIRTPLTLTNAQRVSHVIASTWPEHLADFECEASLYEAGAALFHGVLLIATDETTRMGCATIVCSPAAFDVAEFSWLAVMPQHRKRGVGRALVAAAIDWATEMNMCLFWASSEPDFYEHLGLKPCFPFGRGGRGLYAVWPTPDQGRRL